MERHESVLVQEVCEYLRVAPDDVVCDGTLGLGGHAQYLISTLKGGTFVGIDADDGALAKARQRLAQVSEDVDTHFVEGNFRDIVSITNSIGIDGYDCVLLDLGWGSHHLTSGRGFSFMYDEPLSMCYSTKEGACTVTAHDVVNSFEESNLADIIRGYGGERWAVRIAKHIVERRAESLIETTRQLADVISGAVPRRFHPRNIHVATRTFQAIRITVNDELGALQAFFDSVLPLLKSGARIAVIAFHSLEDRLVKRTFREWEREGVGKRQNKKVLRPSEEELDRNPRARSAKLRTFIIT